MFLGQMRLANLLIQVEYPQLLLQLYIGIRARGSDYRKLTALPDEEN